MKQGRSTVPVKAAEPEPPPSNKMKWTDLLCFPLAPGFARTPQVRNNIEVPLSIKEIQLQLQLDELEEYSSYDVRVETLGGKPIAEGPVHAEKTGSQISFVLPVGELLDRDYLVRVFGVRPADEPAELDCYVFRISRRDPAAPA
jgi:hypothetical protein